MEFDTPDRASRRLIALLLCSFAWPTGNANAQVVDADIEEITVRAERVYRSRETMPAPTLIYDHDFFQQFEPVAVGDMLKRVSGVAFTGDIGEFDAAQMRGLASQYTQVLVNGERIPGASADRSVLVNRIPAELVDRIEIIRSPSADLDAQGVGGTVNIILRDGAALDGGSWRINGTWYDDGTFRGATSASYGGASDSVSYTVAANYQQRLTPKSKVETVFDNEDQFDHLSIAKDVRETTDVSVSATLGFELGGSSTLAFEGSHIDTTVDEDEIIEVFDGELEADELRTEHERFEQQRSVLTARYAQVLGDDLNLEVALSGSRFEENGVVTEAVVEDGQEVPELLERNATQDDEVLLSVSLGWLATPSHELEIGLAAGERQRDSRQTRFENEEDELEDTSPGSGNYAIEESRLDVYFKDTWQVSPALTLEYGLRLEDTDLTQTGIDARASNSEFEVLPSAHLIFQAGDTNQFRFSVAETVRRPGFDQMTPFLDNDSPGEGQLTIGNPSLSAERALGLDLGYEYRFPAHNGIFGANAFYRDIRDKIELTQIDADLFTPDNVGDGQTWGIELDLSMPLAFIGLPDLGLYANYTWLDSEISDPFTGEKRRFNLQPGTIANIDLIHDLPSRGLQYGLSYQKQGSARDFQALEVSRVEYEGNLEFMIEKDLGDRLTLRFTVNNMLDAKKTEETFEFESLEDRIAGEFEQRFFEVEQTGPAFLLTLRGTF